MTTSQTLNPSGQWATTAYTYDGEGNELTEKDPDGDLTSYGYDADGNQTSVTDPDGNTTNFTYNDLGELVGESRYTYESGPATSKVLVSESFNYDTAGDLTSETNFDGQTIYYQYDDAGNKTEELWGSQTSPSATFTYSYDDLGNLLSAAGPTGTETLTYNADNEATSDSFTGNGYSGPVAITNTYDGLGERTTSSLAFNGQADYTNTYGYDGEGNETSVTQTGTSGGNAVASKRVDLAYGPDGQLESETRYAGANERPGRGRQQLR